MCVCVFIYMYMIHIHSTHIYIQIALNSFSFSLKYTESFIFVPNHFSSSCTATFRLETQVTFYIFINAIVYR